MINKQNLWFLTLFSLVLVLSVYYVTMPSDLLLKNEVKYDDTESVISIKEEDELLVSLRLDAEDERLDERRNLESILTSSTATIYEKNEAYDKLTYLNTIYGEEEKLEKKVKDSLGLDCFIEVDGDEINVIAVSKEHDVHLANNIMRTIQEEYQSKVYVTVNFKWYR